VTIEERLLAYRQRITAVYPEIDVQELRLIESGQNNDVLIAERQLVFRFPRHLSGIDVLQREVLLLRSLAGQLPIPIPKPSFTSFEPSQVGTVFMGYRALTGEELQRDLLRTADSLRVLAAQLASFLQALHRIPLDAVPAERSGRDWLAGWDDMYRRLRTHLFPLMHPDARERIAASFNAFLSDERNRSVKPVLIHGDFGSGNILVDPASLTATGVIDWGSAHADDPAVDIAAASTIAEELVEEMIPFYPEVTDMVQRARFYRSTFRLQEGLFGVENDDAAALRAGLKGYT
jgi:aminoglycoside 2''-phosphotransferase